MQNPLYFHQQITDLTNNGQIVLNDRGLVEIWNQWMETASDITAGNALGHNLETLFPQKLPPRLLKAVDQAIQVGHSSVLSSAFTPHPFPLKHPQDPNLKMTQKLFQLSNK